LTVLFHLLTAFLVFLKVIFSSLACLGRQSVCMHLTAVFFYCRCKQSVSAVYLHGLLHSFKRFNCSFHRVDKQVVRSSFNMGRVKFLSLGYVYSDICRLVLLSQKGFGLCASPHTMVDGYELQLEWERHRLLDLEVGFT